MQDLLQKLTDILQTALTEIVQTVQKFIADDPIISVAVLIIVLIGGIVGFYFWNQSE
ncbi:MAG: hypothetical protein U1F76_23215 [Candidatus Competibacteraceae bacterium]